MMEVPATAHIHFALLLPWLVIRRTIKYHTHGPPHPAWGLLLDLICSSSRLYFALAQRHMRDAFLEADVQAPSVPDAAASAPQFRDDAWHPKPRVQRLAGVGTRVDPVRLRGVSDEWRRGVARVGAPAVCAVDVPAFWVVREEADLALDAPAREGEKVVMYLPGGGIHVSTRARASSCVVRPWGDCCTAIAAVSSARATAEQ